MKAVPVAPGVVTRIGTMEVCHASSTTVAALVDEETGIAHLPPVAIWSVRPIAEAGDRAMVDTAARSYRAALLS